MTSTQTRADRDALAQSHIARLSAVPALTDCPCTRNEAKSLIAQTQRYADEPGMLGRNGIGPAVDQCISRARNLGFRPAKRVAA